MNNNQRNSALFVPCKAHGLQEKNPVTAENIEHRSESTVGDMNPKP